ncbi:MAG: hypothetical protein WBY44_33595 [Bryobacteraceae bacterium]|jgi:hypothetical protein
MRVWKISTLIVALAALAAGQQSAGTRASGSASPANQGLRPIFSPIPTVAPGYTVPLDSPEFVFLGPTIDQLTISYPANLAGGAATERTSFTVKMLNQVKPIVSSTVSVTASGSYDYSYVVANDASAADGVKVWSIAMPAVDAVISASHPSWTFDEHAATSDPNPPKGTVSMSPVVLASWHSPAPNLLQPSATVSGFDLKSPYLPGLTLIYARSDEDYALSSPLPAAVNNQLAVMRQPDWMNSRVLAIGPRFPKAWGKDVIAADFKDGVAHLIQLGDLSATSNFVTLLNSALNTLVLSQGASVPLASTIAAAGTPLEKSIANAISISLQ